MKLYDCVIVGAGFTGLAAAYQLSKEGLQVAVVEKDPHLGGLAGVFSFSNGAELEKFTTISSSVTPTFWISFLRWLGGFGPNRSVSDRNLLQRAAVEAIESARFIKIQRVESCRSCAIGSRCASSAPISDYRDIEHLSIREWLEPQVGQRAFEIVWAPLLESKFGEYADQVSAAWMWKKTLTERWFPGGGGHRKTGLPRRRVFPN